MKNLTLKFVLTLVLGLGFAFVAEAQTVKGVVKDATGEPVIGAAVVVEGSTLGVSTGVDGSFVLNLPDANKDVLVVSYIGMKEARVNVAGKTLVEVTLEEDATGIEDVVVVGYGVMKKSDLTGSVGSVAAEDIAARGTVRLEEALQGSVPGVNITQSNSRAGGNFTMQIRGQSSITKSNDPLYVIDGIVSSSMDFLNPEDIERVDVLKDASSTAIYGSRASGGVIMITTKGSKGAQKAQQMTVSYDGYYGVRDVARMPDFMDTKQFMDYRFARYMEYADKSKPSDGAGHPVYVLSNPTSVFPVASGTDYKQSLIFQRYMENKTYDWANEVLRTATQQNHYLSLEGATEASSYRFGVGYQNEENVFVKNDYERINLKGAFDTKLSKVVELGMAANFAYTLQDDFTTDGSNSYSPYNNAFWFAPVLSPWDDNGDLYATPGKPGVSGISFTSTPNPLIDFQLPNAYVDQTRKFHVFGNFYVRLNLYDGLKFTTTLSPNFYHGRQGVFFGTGVTEQFPSGSSYFQNKKYNSAKVVNTDRLDWTWDNQIDYNKTWGDHSLSAMGLFSMYASNKETYEMSGRNISDDKLTFHALGKAGSEGMAINSSYTESSLVSFAARANYSYKGKYMATVTFRADGSSRFAKDNRWGYFPSAALAWRMSEESWMQDASWLDNLKLRVSYGVTG
ncbi:MAG: SusC/RagA family TonB-linked outer membrane protein, partial [Alistipes sp.]|nr:SusC/RagA family TonB-linked outer membrane protein [Alistipes sp.]